MKLQKKYWGLALLTFVGVAISSCIKDEGQPVCDESDELANVTLTFDTRVEEGSFDENENIKTLRILVVDQETGNLDICQRIDNVGNGNPITLHMGLPEGSTKKRFYAIANEASVGLKDTDFPTVGKLPADWQTVLNKHVDEEGKYFSRTSVDIVESGLPITGFKDAIISNGANISIPITFAVSKVKLIVENNKSNPETVRGIRFDQVEPDGGTYLFQSDEIPEGRGSVSLSDINVPANGEAAAMFYTYENQESSQGGYSFSLTIGTETKTINFDDISFTDENGIPKQITSLPRGQQLNIKVILKESAIDDLELIFDVQPWGVKDITIPPFQ